ncbi:hypothetical protein POM88_049380 [Heracleum sosnowskyi]|uniref:Uncharacterized protein n=1 Tax=Heracleum sosnowskyi TaxID=360622 RepID=A0AAD8GWU1_9APIA|nr:hypothetical protein POM88_049380 [Heracleum sosnowskyi]
MEKLLHDDWVVKVNDQLDQVTHSSMVEIEQHWKKRSIYRLPTSVAELNSRAYKPQVVSFGPFHHGQPHLQQMEAHKHRAFLTFLKRSNKPVEYFMESLAPLVQDLKKSYDFLDRQQDTDAFLKLMTIDGCFMLEILRMSASTDGFYQHHTWNATSSANLYDDEDSFVADYAPNDPIFSSHGKLYIMPYIKRDMLMLENQLPMPLLQNLLAIQNDKPMHEEFLNHHMVQFYSPDISVPNLGECLHLLDVYRKSLLSDHHPHKFRRTRPYIINEEIIRSAMELHEAGIRFKTSKTTSLKDISFHSGVLRLPRIVVDDTTEAMFLNLIAFERFHVGAGNEVTAYVFFMDNIIDNAKDVNLLHLQDGLIFSELESSTRYVCKGGRILHENLVKWKDLLLDDGKMGGH